MTKPFILLTGDDSIRAEGLILVKRVIEKFADFIIIGTNKQQSGVGGKISVHNNIQWGEEIVDNTKTIWLDGTPSDAVYFAFEYLDRKPDLVISGMNIGENVQNDMYISGTIGAALATTQTRDVPSIAFSLQINFESNSWKKEHNGDFDEALLDYPGKQVERIILTALDLKFPPKTFWNVNFPISKTNEIKIVKTALSGYFPNNQIIKGNTTKYNPVVCTDNLVANTDTGELNKGFITLTPCKVDFTNYEELEKLKSMKLFS